MDLRWNLEANQELADQNLAEEVANLFERDFDDSLEIHYETWFSRPWHRRYRSGSGARWICGWNSAASTARGSGTSAAAPLPILRR